MLMLLNTKFEALPVALGDSVPALVTVPPLKLSVGVVVKLAPAAVTLTPVTSK